MHSNRLDNVLNAILIVAGITAVVTLSLDHVATDGAALQAKAPVQTVVKVAASPTATPAGKIVASADATDPR